MTSEPDYSLERSGPDVRVKLAGPWTAEQAARVESEAGRLIGEARGSRVILDLGEVERLDTLGAWVLNRIRHDLAGESGDVQFAGADDSQRVLLAQTVYRGFEPPGHVKRSKLVDMFADVGETVCAAGRDFSGGIAFLGAVTSALAGLIARPSKFRLTSLVFHLEQVAFRGVPIIVLVSFLVGGIVAQQGIFQLQRFGATPFVVDLIGILILRELGVLLTSIMVAGRSGSAFTAEIGSMQMREEVDALRVMGLNPIEVLVVPRILALIIGLPILTLLSDLSALFGGGLVAWIYGGISQEVFLARLRDAIALNTFLVGIAKAPFMALVIGLIACIEGLSVEGSAESLGRRVTSSVVKSIFVVIVVDGLFAMFFASIRY